MVHEQNEMDYLNQANNDANNNIYAKSSRNRD
jgi:hypothetical protein